MKIEKCKLKIGEQEIEMPGHRMGEVLDECDQLCKIVAQSIVTAKKKRK